MLDEGVTGIYEMRGHRRALCDDRGRQWSDAASG